MHDPIEVVTDLRSTVRLARIVIDTVEADKLLVAAETIEELLVEIELLKETAARKLRLA